MIPLFENFVLRPLSEKDIPYIFQTIDAERDSLREWLPFVDITHREEDTRVFVDSVLTSENKQFSIYEGDSFMGLVGLKDSDFSNRKTEIGYWLSEKAHGRGVMTAAVKALLAYVFGELDINRLQIKVAVKNVKSKRIPEKLGFVYEGIERDGELLVDNVYTDIAIYSLLKREYKELCKS